MRRSQSHNSIGADRGKGKIHAGELNSKTSKGGIALIKRGVKEKTIGMFRRHETAGQIGSERCAKRGNPIVTHKSREGRGIEDGEPGNQREGMATASERWLGKTAASGRGVIS